MTGTASLAIKHNFETAHRLPFLAGKCQNLHGHSWKVKVTVINYQTDSGIDSDGISIEYSKVKGVVRGWIDNQLDHGTMLGVADSLVEPLMNEDCKLFLFGDKGDWELSPWPTVEAVAWMIADELQDELDKWFDKVWIDSVSIWETAVNNSVWIPHLRKTQGFIETIPKLAQEAKSAKAF